MTAPVTQDLRWYDPLFADQHEQPGTLLGNVTIRFVLTGHRRPPLFFYILTSLVRTGFLQFFALLVFPRVPVKLDDTYRRQALDDSISGHFLSHFLGSPPRHPSAPTEADN